ncbi:MAG: hypothetical protein LBV12_08195 [Puniceicoccales bacterium]|jgi:hypothetical protein|nr:hypothetical protein [Puniceicoccales bacterium]
MKANPSLCIRIFPAVFVLALLPLFAHAGGDAKPAATATSVANSDVGDMSDDSLKALSREDVRKLIWLTSLPTENLTSLRQSIERVEKMNSEERTDLRRKLERLRDANDTQRQKITEDVNKNNPPRGNILMRYWRSLPPEKAKEEMEKFKKMTDEARRAYVAEVRKKMPPAPRDPGKNPQDGNRTPNHGTDKNKERMQRGHEPPRPAQQQRSPADSNKPDSTK